MVGDYTKTTLFNKLFLYAKEVMKTHRIYPYVSFIVKENIIVARGYNQERETFNLTNQDQVVSIREAQKSLDTGDLEGYSLYSFFEPTILGFDVALWSGITDFHWCISAKSYPASYNPLSYSVVDYKRIHPDQITIESGVRENEALQLVKIAEHKKYYI